MQALFPIAIAILTGMTAHDEEFLHDFSARWLRAWNSHETDEVLELLHPDVTWDDRTFWPDVIEGRDGVRTYVDRIWQAMPDVAFDEMGRFFDPAGGRAVVLFRQYGGPPAKVDGDKRFDAHGCDIFLRFDDRLLRHYLSSYDITDMMRQLGMLPERRGRVGGAYHLSLMEASR